MKVHRAESTRTQAPMQHGYRELLSAHMVRVTLATSAAFVVVMALVGPAGTFHGLTLLQRLGFGSLYACISWPLCYAQMVVTHYLFRFRKPAVIWIAVLVATMYAAWPLSAMVFAIESLAHPTYAATIGLRQIYLLFAASAVAWSTLSCYLVWQRVRHATPVIEPPDSADLPEVARDANGAPTAANGDVATGPYPSDSNDASPAGAAQDESADGRDEAAAEYDESADSRPHPISGTPAPEQAPLGAQQLATHRRARQPGALLKLLPDRLGTDLIYIKSEDHYLEVHTTAGSSLVKMRFSDAVDELGDQGMQVHRSYWVATRHVTRSVRSGKRTVLRLTGDHKVPVSVTHLPAVRTILAR